MSSSYPGSIKVTPSIACGALVLGLKTLPGIIFLLKAALEPETLRSAQTSQSLTYCWEEREEKPKKRLLRPPRPPSQLVASSTLWLLSKDSLLSENQLCPAHSCLFRFKVMLSRLLGCLPKWSGLWILVNYTSESGCLRGASPWTELNSEYSDACHPITRPGETRVKLSGIQRWKLVSLSPAYCPCSLPSRPSEYTVLCPIVLPFCEHEPGGTRQRIETSCLQKLPETLSGFVGKGQGSQHPAGRT